MRLGYYLSKAIISGIAIVFIVFVGLLLFVNFLNELNSVGHGDYSFSQAIVFVFAEMPLVIYQIFPTIGLIGVLLGLGSLASSNELTVMRTSGMSLIRISVIIIFTTFLITAVITAVGEGVAPQLASFGNTMKAKDLSNGQAISTLRGIWVRNDKNFYHIDAVKSNTSLSGITKFSFDDQRRLIAASHAQSAKFIDGQWRFYAVKTSLMEADSVANEIQQQTTWPLHFNIHQFSDIEPAQLSLHKLLQQIRYGKISGTNIGALQITLWTRVFQPLTTLIMVLIAIPFIFGPLRSVSIGLRLLSGIMVGLVFFMINRFLISFSLVYQIPPFVAAMIIPGAGVLFSFYLFKWKS